MSESYTYNLKDLWAAYVNKALAENPDWWALYDTKRKVKKGLLFKRNAKGKPVEVMTSIRFNRIIRTYNMQVRRAVIDGYIVSLGAGLGNLAARRVPRNFKKKVVNWQETYKDSPIDPETGERKWKLRYYVSDYYSRVKWEKLCRITNEKNYSFDPCKGNNGKGFKGEFSMAQRLDPSLQFKYKQYQWATEVSALSQSLQG